MPPRLVVVGLTVGALTVCWNLCLAQQPVPSEHRDNTSSQPTVNPGSKPTQPSATQQFTAPDGTTIEVSTEFGEAAIQFDGVELPFSIEQLEELDEMGAHPSILGPDVETPGDHRKPNESYDEDAAVGPGDKILGGNTQDDATQLVDNRQVRSACRLLPFAQVVAVENSSGFTCSGVLLSPRHVLTASHCLPATEVLVGPTVDAPLDRSAVEDAAPAPSGGDAAVLTLQTPLSGAKVATFHPGGVPQFGEVALLGFGSDDPRGITGAGVLRGTRVSLAGDSCDATRARTTGCDPDSELVISSASGADTCDGDSGGPAFVCTDAGWQLLAITSRPVASSRARCGDGGVYLRTELLRDWLASELERGENEDD